MDLSLISHTAALRQSFEMATADDSAKGICRRHAATNSEARSALAAIAADFAGVGDMADKIGRFRQQLVRKNLQSRVGSIFQCQIKHRNRMFQAATSVDCLADMINIGGITEESMGMAFNNAAAARDVERLAFLYRNGVRTPIPDLYDWVCDSTRTLFDLQKYEWLVKCGMPVVCALEKLFKPLETMVPPTPVEDRSAHIEDALRLHDPEKVGERLSRYVVGALEYFTVTWEEVKETRSCTVLEHLYLSGFDELVTLFIQREFATLSPASAKQWVENKNAYHILIGQKYFSSLWALLSPPAAVVILAPLPELIQTKLLNVCRTQHPFFVRQVELQLRLKRPLRHSGSGVLSIPTSG